MTRRERERAERHDLIVRTARELAEAEGWAAVTTRRLADLIEYSQPVLYSHFAGKDAIVAAVAVEGFAELADAVDRARTAVGSPPDAVHAVAEAYVDFAETNPAVYDAMFSRAAGLPFARPDAPVPLRDAFAGLRATVAPVAGTRDPDVLTEVAWGALHGLVTLERDGRLSDGNHAGRLATTVALLLG
ncbi:TetR/AcrR family transcriptional regulator [Actinophytocola sp.]|uniref:TetR/AcrR family transcriptional regulator n=1 Tax=Actinophytocola sp. TaxID=1872138 RepID=UPI0025C2AD1E|nr:TetR/AcrR family transcriptional regulator [Actinophytocola sp.]